MVKKKFQCSPYSFILTLYPVIFVIINRAIPKANKIDDFFSVITIFWSLSYTLLVRRKVIIKLSIYDLKIITIHFLYFLLTALNDTR